MSESLPLQGGFPFSTSQDSKSRLTPRPAGGSLAGNSRRTRQLSLSATRARRPGAEPDRPHESTKHLQRSDIYTGPASDNGNRAPSGSLALRHDLKPRHLRCRETGHSGDAAPESAENSLNHPLPHRAEKNSSCLFLKQQNRQPARGRHSETQPMTWHGECIKELRYCSTEPAPRSRPFDRHNFSPNSRVTQ